MRKLLFLCLCTFTLASCKTTQLHHSQATTPDLSIANRSYLAQGKRYFEDGYYKRAMRLLLPIACDGNAEAQYAVGYMYYYGYGVSQDIDVGRFWIKRAADKGFKPAQEALGLMSKWRDDDHDAREKYQEGEIRI